MARSAEQAAYLVGRQVGDDFFAGAEGVVDVFDPVGAHDAFHHFLVHRERHHHPAALDHGGPVLVADGMSQFEGYVDDLFGRFAGQGGQVGDQHLVEPDAQHHHAPVGGVVFKDVAVEQLRVAFERYGIFGLAVARGGKTAFLRRPLVELDGFDVGVFRAGGPFGVAEVADDGMVDFHGQECSLGL